MKKIKNSLVENSISYHDNSSVYEKLTKSEDFPNKIKKFLLPKIKEKIVIDFGCGNGKYAELLSNKTAKYIGIDVSNEQIKRARRKFNNSKKVSFIHSSVEKIKLPSNYADVVISSWAISTINGYTRKSKSIKEALRILKKGGKIFLIENDIGGEFEIIRGRYPDIKRTKEYNDWILEKGFKVKKRIKTYFKFDSLKQAREVISSIWGRKAGNLVKSNRIKHNVIIFERKK